MREAVYFWRRTDVEGLERLVLTRSDAGAEARGTVLNLEDGGLRLEHHWVLDAAWRAQQVTVERWGTGGHGRLEMVRTGAGWQVDGVPRPDLDGAEEPDLSVTPFCNSLPIRRLGRGDDATHTLDTAFVDGAALTVQRSRQRYERLGTHRVRYVDLGVSAGFTAELRLDADDFVMRYEHLFERVAG